MQITLDGTFLYFGFRTELVNFGTWESDQSFIGAIFEHRNRDFTNYNFYIFVNYRYHSLFDKVTTIPCYSEYSSEMN